MKNLNFFSSWAKAREEKRAYQLISSKMENLKSLARQGSMIDFGDFYLRSGKILKGALSAEARPFLIDDGVYAVEKDSFAVDFTLNCETIKALIFEKIKASATRLYGAKGRVKRAYVEVFFTNHVCAFGCAI